MNIFNEIMNKTFIVHGFDFQTLSPKLWTMEFKHVYPSNYVTVIQTDCLNINEYLCKYKVSNGGGCVSLFLEKNPNNPYDWMITKKQNFHELWVAGQGGAMNFKLTEDLSSLII